MQLIALELGHWKQVERLSNYCFNYLPVGPDGPGCPEGPESPCGPSGPVGPGAPTGPVAPRENTSRGQ